MYFPKSAARNLEGSTSLDELPAPVELDTRQIENFDGVVLDVRPNAVYGEGHVPNSINIGLGGQFATWAGTMIPIGTNIALVGDTQEQIDEAAMRLARVGHDSVTGFVVFGNYSGKRRVTPQVSVEETAKILASGNPAQIVDVRRVMEHAGGHAPGAVNIPLNRLPSDFEKLSPEIPTYVICQSGYRSSIGTSILENAGFTEVYNVAGGTATWIKAGMETEKPEVAAAG
jgi:rhodanese-related sulfurtransferase